ncbi:hypothetical protein CH330_04975, partial [candidate division WOR-3 bacterium JGI_Cruoil_03_51_56]
MLVCIGEEIEMVRRKNVRNRETDYSRNIRIAAIMALVLVTAGFLFVRMPEARPYEPRTSSETITIPLPDKLLETKEPPKPRVRPKLPIADPKGKETDPGVGKHEFNELTRSPSDLPSLEPVPFWKVEVKPAAVYLETQRYPDMARMAGIEGTVVVKVLVDTTGAVA